MKTELLYLEDSYLKEWDAKVVSANGKFIVLDKSAFYYTSGGQPHDTGVIKKGDSEYKVVFGGKFDGEISYEMDKESLKEGDSVSCVVDWSRRYKLMRMHTAAHIVAGAVHRKTGALITGGQLDLEKSKMDFSLENFDRSLIDECIVIANEIVEKDLVVSAEFKSREEADKMPQLSKLAKGLPAEIKEVRILSVGDFDIQADGGTQVKSTKEVGKISLLKCDNKGASR
ncbi:MAG: alanyl-tRNA editing protein, partial [Candidatus Woesearchaeota archaeon]|nr:alanyl-tRNA editing protein [Candidatus Woesearchaeota archaeon]